MENTSQAVPQATKPFLSALNLLRGCAALFVFLFHMHVNLKYDYHILNFIVRQASYWMTLFFMLSGFVLYYAKNSIDFSSRPEIVDFLKKRLAAIFPLYFFIWIFYIILDGPGRNPVLNDAVVLPFQLSLLFEFQHYDYRTNSGTWFFSCIFMCYLLFPGIKTYLKDAPRKDDLTFLIILFILNSLAPKAGELYGFSIYVNAFCRIFEFVFGCILAKQLISLENNEKLKKFTAPLAAFAILFSACGLFSLEKYNVFSAYQNQTFLNWFSMLSGGAMLIFLGLSRENIFNKIAQFRPAAWFSNHSLEFWVATFFTTTLIADFITPRIFSKMEFAWHGNLQRVIISLLINTLIAFLLGIYNKLTQKLFYKFSLYKIFSGCILILASILFINWLRL